MSMSDPISDMLTRIRNAQSVGKKVVIMPSSKIKVEISRVLMNEGYIRSFLVEYKNNFLILKVVLKYYKGNPVIECIKRISKPGLRVYKRYKKVPKVVNGLGIAIISTSRGIITDYEARNLHVGGEVICYVS